ncbi:MAG: response regulator [Hahellaceae bacterium]|nr:response regulator [Hahellaceae bacterium]MCP5169778.1 response regulator [Hahellaceae bacterium]
MNSVRMPLHHLSILLVEDNPDHADLISEMLEEAGVSTITHVTSGQKALDFLIDNHGSSRPVNLVLMDIKMPRMTGLETLDKIKSHRLLRTMPVLMLSTSDNQKDIRDSFDRGAAGYITKPLTLPDLEAVLLRLI